MLPLLMRLKIREKIKRLPQLTSSSNGFHVEFNNLEDFIKFIRFIRREDFDENLLIRETKETIDASTKLQDAIDKGKQNG